MKRFIYSEEEKAKHRKIYKPIVALFFPYFRLYFCADGFCRYSSAADHSRVQEDLSYFLACYHGRENANEFISKCLSQLALWK
jgi:hypothetical protein